jgi:hypothetical protein
MFTAAEALAAYSAAGARDCSASEKARNGGSESRALQTWEDEGGPALQERA